MPHSFKDIDGGGSLGRQADPTEEYSEGSAWCPQIHYPQSYRLWIHTNL